MFGIKNLQNIASNIAIMALNMRPPTKEQYGNRHSKILISSLPIQSWYSIESEVPKDKNDK